MACCEVCLISEQPNKAPEGVTELMCVQVASFADGTKNAAKMSVKKGWKWSEHMKPIVKTEWCEKAHFGVLTSGQIKVTMQDGKETVISPGNFYSIDPGHDAEVLEDIEGYEFSYMHGMSAPK